MAEYDDEVREILEKCHTIAVVGIKQDESSDAHRIPRYMRDHGYRILPVNPKLERVMDEPCVASLTDLTEPVDVIDLFRAAEHLPSHADEILAMSPRPMAVWMQLGIHHGPTAARLRAAGIRVVQDRCIMVEHRRSVEGAGDDCAA